MKKIRKGLSLLWIVLLVAFFALGCTRRVVVVHTAPPPPRAEVKPAPPYPNAVWIPGHWKWKRGRYVWVPGHWAKPRRGYVWVPGHWEKRPRGWVWVPGHWKRR